MDSSFGGTGLARQWVISGHRFQLGLKQLEKHWFLFHLPWRLCRTEPLANEDFVSMHNIARYLLGATSRAKTTNRHFTGL